MPWYFAVSTNLMPAKYLIAKCIPSNLNHLSSASEEELWSESSLLTRVFLDVWGKVKAGEANLSPKVKEGRPSLMDLNVELAKRMLAHCNFCRWNCKIDRSKGTRHGTCQLESTSRVGSYFHHRGEELIFRGTGGSGTIFFTSCNMRCSFCQNGDISTDKDNGIPITPSTLALMAWQLRMEGCHNVNWVGGEPTIHLHTIVEAISLLDSLNKPDRRQFNYIQSVKADSGGYFDSWQKNSENAFYQGRFNCPQLWNSNFFMTREAMNILRNMMDVWLPDFKFGPGKCALDISRTPWYWETVTGNLRLVHDWGEDMVIRHLIMPNHVECCTKPVLEWIAKNMPEVPVNIMDQYHPDNLCDPESSKYRERYNDISRACTAEEITKSYQYAKELGLNFESLSYEKALYGRR
jgi:putative pyruvate formate lyase activating enzyme